MQTNANPRWAANTIADTRVYSILEVHSKWVVVCVPGESFAFPGNTSTLRGFEQEKLIFYFWRWDNANRKEHVAMMMWAGV